MVWVAYLRRCDRISIGLPHLQYPCLIAEVLSPNTEIRDRGQKFRNYRGMDTLQEYFLIDCDRPSLEIYHRNKTTTEN